MPLPNHLVIEFGRLSLANTGEVWTLGVLLLDRARMVIIR